MSDPNCPDCKGTGCLEVETIEVGKPIYRQGKIIYDIHAKGDWHTAVCHCVGENEHVDSSG